MSELGDLREARYPLMRVSDFMRGGYKRLTEPVTVVVGFTPLFDVIPVQAPSSPENGSTGVLRAPVEPHAPQAEGSPESGVPDRDTTGRRSTSSTGKGKAGSAGDTRGSAPTRTKPVDLTRGA